MPTFLSGIETVNISKLRIFSPTGNDTITEGLSAPTKIKEDYDFYTISQNLTRTLQASDSGKELRCVAGHIALLPPNNQKAHTLRVQCKCDIICPIKLWVKKKCQ